MSHWPEQNDNQLIKAIQEGSHPAFAELVERHNQRYYHLAYRFLQNASDAEEIVQEAFLKFWQQPDRFDVTQKAQFTTWFYRVVMNLCLDLKKSKGYGQQNLAHEEPTYTERPEEQLIQTEQLQQLEQAIQGLPERQQAAVNLCCQYELSNKEAAEIMEVTVKALESLLMRAKQTLKNKLYRGHS